ncbi:MAG TPA: 30S ribosomal protein S6 [Thermoguttaceae bacterium]|nr:30S ribosomal protein S6 [Thermoguttaceae bacterium]
MAETVYEGMFLLDSNRYGRDPEGVAGQVPGMIREAGGEVLVSRMWEERRLAFPVKGRRKGTYWLTYFRMDGGKLVDLKRKSQLNENVLRVLFIKIDPRIVDTLVEHAQTPEGKSASERTEEKKAESTEEAPKKTEEPAKEEDAAAEADSGDQAAPEDKAD